MKSKYVIARERSDRGNPGLAYGIEIPRLHPPPPVGGWRFSLGMTDEDSPSLRL